MREPAVAGMFYPASEKGLLKELKACFKKGPGREAPKKGRKVSGLVSPHAGYTYSGPTAAFGFLAAADGGLPRSVVIIGPNHSGLGKRIGVSSEDFRTPLGIMRNDRELSGSMEGHHDELSHLREHSMEVQLPFVQFFSGDIEQVCISLGHPGRGEPGMSEEELEIEQAKEVGGMVADAIRSVGKDVLVVASSDFTHCGWNYGYPVPSGMNAGEFARSRDLPVIDKLLEGDIEGALEMKRKLVTTACGMGPIMAMIYAVKELGGSEMKLMDYTTSYDVSPSHSAVGYGSIVYYR